MSIPELLADRRICVCVGSGGVGKTTTSAAIALGMAARGLRVCVITIDPARRLATAMGLAELGNEPTRVPMERFTAAGLGMTGELWAMMLDPKRTFDDLIDAAAASPEQAAGVKANPIYGQLSSAVAGAQEFTAVSKLYELAGSRRFDLLVLDTPPTRNALDFIEAPRRLTGFLEGRALQAFLRPTGFGMRILGVGTAPLTAALRRVTGVDLISDITTFFGLLGPIGSVLAERARAVEELMASSRTAFLIIASAQPASVDEALWFRRTLERAGLPFRGVVVNRFHRQAPERPDGPALSDRLTRALGGDVGLARRVLEADADGARLAEGDGAELARLQDGLSGQPVLTVPQFDESVHDAAGLVRIVDALFGI